MGVTELVAAIVAMCCVTAVLIAFIEKAGSRRRPISAADAEAILAERFARGEIDETEYATRMSTLRLGPPLQIH